MAHTETFTRAKQSLNKAHLALERIADRRKQNLETIRRRADLDAATRDRLAAAVNRAAANEFIAARKEIDKALADARAAVRKGRRADDHWDVASELRINAATGRLRAFLDDPETNLEDLATSFINDAVEAGDRSTLLALRRELPTAARRRGLPPKVTDRLLERLDLLTDDVEIVSSVAHGRELPKIERSVANLVGSFEAEISGRSSANVYLRADGEVAYRNGWGPDAEGRVTAPKAEAVQHANDVERLEAEYASMFGGHPND